MRKKRLDYKSHVRHLLKLVLVLVVAFAGPVSTWAQYSRRDSSMADFNADIKSRSIALRIGGGGQGNFCYQVGLARNTFVGSPHIFHGSSIYAVFASVRNLQSGEIIASGVRLGAETYGSGGLLGAEVSTFWSGHLTDVLIAPKIGVGIPELSLYYAYHISTQTWVLEKLGQHEVTLQISPYIWYYERLKHETRWFWMRGRAKKS